MSIEVSPPAKSPQDVVIATLEFARKGIITLGKDVIQQPHLKRPLLLSRLRQLCEKLDFSLQILRGELTAKALTEGKEQ